MNTHRTPFGARNYEYFSEDGTLAGYISASTVQGAASQGVYAYIKHFAMYEMNAKMVCVWSNEQAMLSTYAGGPNMVQDPEAASSVKYMRQACKNVMYTVVNSWVYEEDGVDTGMPAWEKAVIGADVAVGVILIGLGALVWRRYRKSRAEEA